MRSTALRHASDVGRNKAGERDYMCAHKYKVILADPPWSYSNSGCRGAAANQYSTMSLSDMKQLPVSEFTDPDCVLVMWATWPKLAEDCLPLMQAWGFDYVTGFPWVKVTSVSTNLWGVLEIKVPYGIGFWIRGCTEPVLIGRRGSPKPPPNGFIGLLSENLFHSRKPESIYHFCESMPGPYLEMFARRKRSGWDAFGNEIKDGIQMGAPENKESGFTSANTRSMPVAQLLADFPCL